MTLSKPTTNTIADAMPSIQLLVRDWSENKTQIEITKINKFLSDLAHHLQDSKGTIDTAYLESAEAKKILERTIEIGIHENEPQKSGLLFLFLTNFLDLRFSGDKNKQQILTILKKITSIQAAILRDTAEWLTLAYGRDVVQQSTDYKPENNEQSFVGYIMESIVALFTRLTIETVAAHLDALVEMGGFDIANNGNEIQHFGQTGRGFKPTKLGLQLLGYLRVFKTV